MHKEPQRCGLHLKPCEDLWRRLSAARDVNNFSDILELFDTARTQYVDWMSSEMDKEIENGGIDRLLLALIPAMFVAVISVACLPTTSLAQEIYIVHGKRGVVTFTTRKPAAGSFDTLRYKKPAFSTFVRSRGMWKVKPVSSDYDALIESAADDQSIDPTLLKALIHVESGFNPKAKSPAGAMGLMQLIPGTAKRFGVSDAYHPEKNLAGGTKYLRFLLDRYSGNETLALAAYNAGEGSVDDNLAVPPYAETQTYVRRVLKIRELYRCVESGRKNCPRSVFVQ